MAGASFALASETSVVATLRPEVQTRALLKASDGTSETDSALTWYSAQKLSLVGKGWDNTTTWSSRLPAEAMDRVTSTVATLANCSAGIAVHFATDAKTIGAVWDSKGAMAHMANTGSGGLDLYARQQNSWKYVGTGIPRSSRTLAKIASGQPGQMTEYLLYLPLYSPVEDLNIGVDAGAKIYPVYETRTDRLPIVFYGTSITQGGCASRAGMCHVAILGRQLDREVINLGFSGAGKSEPVMAELISQIPASLYVIEPLPNMTTEMVTQRLPEFVRTIRKRRPDTPILLVQNPLSGNTSTQNSALTAIFETLRSEGVQKLTLLPSENQLTGAENGTVDGVHPTDLGFDRMASAYLNFLEAIIEKD